MLNSRVRFESREEQRLKAARWNVSFLESLLNGGFKDPDLQCLTESYGAQVATLKAIRFWAVDLVRVVLGQSDYVYIRGQVWSGSPPVHILENQDNEERVLGLSEFHRWTGHRAIVELSIDRVGGGPLRGYIHVIAEPDQPVYLFEGDVYKTCPDGSADKHYAKIEMCNSVQLRKRLLKDICGFNHKF